MAALGVVIPTVGREQPLGRVLGCLERQRSAAGHFEVVVVHGEAADGKAVQAAIGRRPYEVRRLVSGQGDASSNRNVGWRALSTPLVLFLDDDVLASGDLISEHLAAHTRWPEPEVGVLGHVRWPRRPRPTTFMRWLDHGIQFDFRGLCAGASVGWWHFYTANASVKRELLDRVGGFDAERFPFGYEDLDLAARMGGHGFSLRYVPSAEAEHLHPQTLADWRERVRRIAFSERRFCEVHPEAKPYFHDLFAAALEHPPASGRGRRLARLIPPEAPLLGGRVWASVDMWHRQQLAARFLEAWEAAGAGGS